MALWDNTHVPTDNQRQRVKDLAIAGVPKHLIAKIIKIDDETLNKHYDYELSCAEPEAVEAISKTVFSQALNGNEKSQALYLKTRGAKYGWIEKQVIETVSSEESQALQEKVKELEEQYQKDF